MIMVKCVRTIIPHFLFLLHILVGFGCVLVFSISPWDGFSPAVGDPEMKSSNIRVGLESWNFCNEVGIEAVNMPSPRFADCADLYCPVISVSDVKDIQNSEGGCKVHHRVRESDNSLKTGDKFPSQDYKSYPNPDLYAREKELYLGSLCKGTYGGQAWHFWMIMLKNGNFDKTTTLCPENGRKVDKINTTRNFPCFGKGCMNHPLIYHNYSRLDSDKDGKLPHLTGGFYGTYDLDAGVRNNMGDKSFFSVSWKKNTTTQSWIFSHKLTTSSRYPWLMLYLRADAARGFNGGYHYEGRGIVTKPLVSPNFKVKLTLDIKQGGGANSQFYLVDIGSCWKNEGSACDGDVTTDVTRYSEMIINPETSNWCKPNNLVSCPPYHISSKGEIIHRNDTARFPYAAYHLYCGRGNAKYLEYPFDVCDPYSNPQAQELVQILPHPEWGVHGYPSKQGEGWINDPRTWELDVGALSARLYFYQDPGTTPAKRVWSSINVGTEIYISSKGQTAEWTVSDFDVLVKDDSSGWYRSKSL